MGLGLKNGQVTNKSLAVRDMLKMAEGIEPKSSLSGRTSSCSDEEDALKRLAGIEPESSLPPKCKYSSFGSDPNNDGISRLIGCMQKLQTSIFANEPSDGQRAAKAVVLVTELSEEREVPLGVEGWCLPTPCKKVQGMDFVARSIACDTNPFASRSVVYQFFCQDIVRVMSDVVFKSVCGEASNNLNRS